MIQITDLQFKYPDSAFQLSLPNWSVESGHQCALIGPSGSGKTTLLSLLAGILKPNSGQIQIGEHSVEQMTEPQRRDFRISECGLIFQSFELIPYLNVLQNIQLPYYLNPILEQSPETELRACQLAEQLGVSNYLERPVTSLSIGEQQRLAICRALITKPKIILADEPTASLDQANVDRVMKILFEYSKDSNATLIMSTHDSNLFSRFDQRLDFSELLTEAS